MRDVHRESAEQVRYMRQPEVLAQVPFSAATLWRKVKDGSFVKPVKLSIRITAWKRSDVEEWLRHKEVAQ